MNYDGFMVYVSSLQRKLEEAKGAHVGPEKVDLYVYPDIVQGHLVFKLLSGLKGWVNAEISLSRVAQPEVVMGGNISEGIALPINLFAGAPEASYVLIRRRDEPDSVASQDTSSDSQLSE